MWEKEDLEPNDLDKGRDGKKYLDEQKGHLIKCNQP